MAHTFWIGVSSLMENRIIVGNFESTKNPNISGENTRLLQVFFAIVFIFICIKICDEIGLRGQSNKSDIISGRVVILQLIDVYTLLFQYFNK
jgi:hypothetical protein